VVRRLKKALPAHFLSQEGPALAEALEDLGRNPKSIEGEAGKIYRYLVHERRLIAHFIAAYLKSV